MLYVLIKRINRIILNVWMKLDLDLVMWERLFCFWLKMFILRVFVCFMVIRIINMWKIWWLCLIRLNFLGYYCLGMWDLKNMVVMMKKVMWFRWCIRFLLWIWWRRYKYSLCSMGIFIKINMSLIGMMIYNFCVNGYGLLYLNLEIYLYI